MGFLSPVSLRHDRSGRSFSKIQVDGKESQEDVDLYMLDSKATGDEEEGVCRVFLLRLEDHRCYKLLQLPISQLPHCLHLNRPFALGTPEPTVCNMYCQCTSPVRSRQTTSRFLRLDTVAEQLWSCCSAAQLEFVA